MADSYCDHGAYGNTNRLGLDTPAWGIPQEGDGSNKDAATASSTASITFSNAPSSGAFSVCSAAVSTTGVIGAASASAAATALATNINNTTNPVSSNAAIGTPQLRNLVYARVKPDDATCVQIMMRVGSASLNTANNSFAAFTNTLNNVSGTQQFVGGVGGCWGWYLNHVALGVSSGIALISYGLFAFKPMVASPVLPTSSDTIHVRNGKMIDIPASFDNLMPTFDSCQLVDDGTIWAGDSPAGQVTIRIGSTGSWGSGRTIRHCTETDYGVTARRARRRGGLKLAMSTNPAGNMTLSFHLTGNGSTHHVLYENVLFVDESPANAGSMQWVLKTWCSPVMSWINCDFTVVNPQTAIQPIIVPMAYNNRPGWDLYEGCNFTFNISGSGTNLGPLISNADASFINAPYYAVVRNCNFKGLDAGFDLYTSAPGARATQQWPLDIRFENVTGIKMAGSTWGLAVMQPFFSDADLHRLYLSTASPVAAFRIENTRGYTDWIANAGFPTLSATLPDQVTPYSLRHAWMANGIVSRHFPATVTPMSALNLIGAGARTITLEMFVPSAQALDLETMKVSVSYTNTDGQAKQEVCAAPVASSATWAMNGGNYPGYVAKKVTLTTADPVAANSEIVVQPRLSAAPVGNVNTFLFFDPEFVVT